MPYQLTNSMSNTKFDGSLLTSCKLGDEESWRQLFRSLYPVAKWVTMRILHDLSEQAREEIAQEAMIALARKIQTIVDLEHAERFVRSVAKKKCIDFIRKNRVKFEELPEDYEAPIREGLEEDVIMRLKCAVREIGEPCRTIIRRRFYDGWQHKTIAFKLDMDVNQVGVRIQRCLKTLKMLISSRKVTTEDII